MRYLKLLTIVCLIFPFSTSFGQEQKNIAKLNLTALLLKNISVNYERIVSKKVSLSLGVKYMPPTGIPFQQTLVNYEVLDANDELNNLIVNSLSITPEVRFYLNKKGNGRGFYIAPFYRFATYNSDALPVSYGVNSNKTVLINGQIKSYTGGFSIGTQFKLGERMVLDWTILGLHYGKSAGKLDGSPDSPFTQAEQTVT